MNFHDFGPDKIEKQSIMILSSYSSKSYTSVDLSDSEVIFLHEEKDIIFLAFLCCVFVDRLRYIIGKLINRFIYLIDNISSVERDVNVRLVKACGISIIRESFLSDLKKT